MQEPAPKGIIQFPDQHERDLQKKIALESTRAGHPMTPADINPNKDLSLENITRLVTEEWDNDTDASHRTVSGKSKDGLGMNARRWLKQKLGKAA